MKKVHPYLSRSVLIPALTMLVSCLVLISCTGTTIDDKNGGKPAERASDASRTPTSTANESTTLTPQERTPQDPAQERQAFFVANSLKEARRALELKLFGDAARLAAQVLEVESGNKEAREILTTASELMGNAKAPTAGQRFQHEVTKRLVEQERDRFKAEQEMRVGDAHLEAGRHDDAIESYRRGALILRYSTSFTPGSTLEKMLEQKLADATKAKAKADQDRETARRVASRKQLEDEEHKSRINTNARARTLLIEANTAFQTGNYQRSVTLIDEVLRLQPGNANAQALHSLAEQARHENAIETARQDWKGEWSRTFDEINSSDIAQTDSIKFDTKRWREVLEREPLKFTPPEDLDTPEEKAILEKLQNTRIEHRFASADVEAWSTYYARVTEVNFVVTPQVKEMDAATTTLTDFNLPPMPVSQALNVIGQQTGVRWKVQNGVVQLVTADKAGGRTFLRPFEVRDLVQGVKDKPGRELKLTAPGEDPGKVDEDEEAKPTVVDGNKLIDTIKNTIEPGTWEGGEASIAEVKGVLMVKHNRDVHAKIERFLNDLRLAVGMQVDVEARFLKVADNFLEDVGVDFRGLGNQASEGVAGRGLEQNNRSNAAFDDFGRRENTNPATPGVIGTGTEPGVFYDDGQDGDLMGRTEHLFDRTLGGREGGLDNAGGMSIQYAFLDDAQLEVILRAVQKQERSEEITAPRLLVYNNKRANMQVLRATSYIKDFDVEIAQAAAVANPVIDVVRDGVVLDVRPVVSADRKFVTMELRPTVLTLQLPIPTFTTTLGVGQPISIQLPRVTRQTVRTTVTMPDGGTILLGGMSLAEKQNEMSGVPILKDLPILSFLFSRKGTYVLNERIVILLRAKILISAEHEPLHVPPDASWMLTGTK